MYMTSLVYVVVLGGGGIPTAYHPVSKPTTLPTQYFSPTVPILPNMLLQLKVRL